MQDNGLTLGSLFDGLSGFPLSGVMSGIVPIWASEIEPYPLRVSAARFPDMVQLGSVTDIDGGKIEPVDIITFGSPCQDLSVAGKQKGLAGARSGLYVEAVRIIREMKEATGGEFPKWLVFENVPGLLSSNGGADFITAMDMLQDEGFIPDPNILDAQNMGVPQRRKRVYIAWLNVDYTMRQRTNLSKIITLQLLTELLQITLVERLRALENAPKELAALPRKLSEDGAKKRIKLFSLQKVDRLLTLQENLDEIQVIYQNGRENWESLDGNDQTVQITLMDMVMKSSDLTTELPSGYIAGLLKKVLDENLKTMKSSTTSTLTSETTTLTISTYFKMLGNIQNVIGVYLDWLEQTNPMYLNYCEWVQSYLTEMRVCINAAVKYEKSVEQMGWHDNIRLCERTFNALEKYVERNIRNGCRPEILPEREGVSGDSPQSGTPWEGTAADAERSVGGSCCFGIDQQGGKGTAAYAVDVSPTLCSDSHGTPHGVAYLADNVKCLNPWDCQSKRQHDIDGVYPTLQAYNGGGGRCDGVIYPNVARTLAARHDSSPCADRGQNVVIIDCRNLVGNEELSATLQAKNEGGFSLNFVNPIVYDARGNGDGITSPTLTGDHQNRVTDYTAVCVGNSQLHQTDPGDKTGALNCMHDQQAVITTAKPPRKYIVRRLTPLECVRLQGYPDCWLDGVEGSDSAKYKALGNSLAIPCAFDVMNRIARFVEREKED